MITAYKILAEEREETTWRAYA